MAGCMYADPFARGFFANESLPLAERVGLALREGAAYTDISFNAHRLPCASGRPATGGMFFGFADGLGYDFSSTRRLIEAYPAEEEILRSYAAKMKRFCEETDAFPKTERGKRLSDAGAMWAGTWGGHSNPDFGLILSIGTDGIRERIEQNRRKHPGNDGFYNGCAYAMDALDILGKRFRELALANAQAGENEAERAHYREIARAFEIVPQKPAPDFAAACLAFWMVFTFDGIDSPGRFDQYMYRAWAQTADKTKAREYLVRVWDSFRDTRAWNLCIGGSDENWNDQTNELSYEILAVAGEKKYTTPNITMRVHRNTPLALWKAAAETLATGIGMPALYNDETVCAALESIGIPKEHSHLYCMNGCNQIDIMGKSHMGLEDGEVVLAKCLEYALHNGRNALTGELDTVETGDATQFTSYEQLENAFFRQLDLVICETCMAANGAQHRRAAYSPNPLRSCLIEGCLEKGLDYRNGGPLYNHGQILAEGIADTGDSLYAVKKLVFDEKKYTMAELLEALLADFEGYETLHRDFAGVEKFGNDSNAVDEITAKVVNRFLTSLKTHRTYRGGIFTGGCSPYDRSAYHARHVGALPNGKRAGDPTFADSIGAVPGCDTAGPTALLNSVLHFKHTEACSGFILQLKFDKKLFSSENGKENFVSLAKAYFGQGGQQLTISVVSREELLDARKNPQAHKNLIVRVGGYSDYFVNLPPDLQDNVIARTHIEI